jgi:hypothetical protein
MPRALDIERVEAQIAVDPAAEGFGALADAYRRQGRVAEARRVVDAGLALAPDDPAARLARALLLLDDGDAGAAREEIERVVTSLTVAVWGSAEEPPKEAPLAIEDDELEAALADAAPIRDDVVSQEPVAAAPVVEVAAREPAARSERGEGFAIEEAPVFVTETMARLFAAQGDDRSADAIRRRLEGVAPETGETEEDDGARDATRRVVATLETWLRNLQGIRS